MSTRRRAANLSPDTGGRLEDMAITIREQVALTNRMLQHLEANKAKAANVPSVNP